MKSFGIQNTFVNHIVSCSGAPQKTAGKICLHSLENGSEKKAKRLPKPKIDYGIKRTIGLLLIKLEIPINTSDSLKILQLPLYQALKNLFSKRSIFC